MKVIIKSKNKKVSSELKKKEEKKMKYKGSLVLLVILAVFLVYVPKAMSATKACTVVSNQATVNFSVGGIVQPPVNSNTKDFTVGAKINVTVTNNDTANVTVTPGGKAALKFTVTNEGNVTNDVALSYVAAATGTASPYGGGNDSFDGTNIAIYEDTNSNGTYDDGTDTASTSINDLAPGSSKVYFIVYNANDLSQPGGNIAVYYLVAEAKWADGSTISEGSSSVTQTMSGDAVCGGGTVINIVFADANGPAPDTNDGNRDGKHSDDGAYIVANVISVTKNYTIISDPVNGTTNPKAIPGAIVEYSISISNTGGASAILTTITDALNNNLKIVSTADSASWEVAGSTRSTKSGTLTADNNNADGLTHSNPANSGGTVTATMTTILSSEGGYSAGELKNGEEVTIKFKVEIQ